MIAARIDVYVTRKSRFALLVTDHRDEARMWLRHRGFPAFYSHKHDAFLVRATEVPDLRAMCQHEHLSLVEHRASGPRQAQIRKHHAITRAQRRSAA